MGKILERARATIREAERQRGREAERQRGREAEKQRSREAERNRVANRTFPFSTHHEAEVRLHGHLEEVGACGDLGAEAVGLADGITEVGLHPLHPEVADHHPHPQGPEAAAERHLREEEEELRNTV